MELYAAGLVVVALLIALAIWWARRQAVAETENAALRGAEEIRRDVQEIGNRPSAGRAAVVAWMRGRRADR
jgi:uncharacterized membrane protein YqiK